MKSPNVLPESFLLCFRFERPHTEWVDEGDRFSCVYSSDYSTLASGKSPGRSILLIAPTPAWRANGAIPPCQRYIYTGPIMTINEWYKPGETVTHAGIYRVRHASHRPPHKSLIAERIFPACGVCGLAVRYGDELSVPTKASRSTARDPHRT
jgi:hypothetical protein